MDLKFENNLEKNQKDDIKSNYNDECLFKIENNNDNENDNSNDKLKHENEEEIDDNINIEKENSDLLNMPLLINQNQDINENLPNDKINNNNINENEKSEKIKEKEKLDEEKEIITKNSIIFSPILSPFQKKEENPLIPKNIKYGISPEGNPVEIKPELNQKLIAYIIQKDSDNKNNYLIDLKGNLLEKVEDDYYIYKDKDELIIIKNFDIQNPELRIYGHRKINFEEIKKNFSENNINNNKNRSVILELNKNNKNININESNKFKKINISQQNINLENDNFKNQMKIWRQRYGKNNEFINTKNNNNYKTKDNNNYNGINNKMMYRKLMHSNSNYKKNNNELISRTDSILRMNSDYNVSKYKKLVKNKSTDNIKNISKFAKKRNYSNINILNCKIKKERKIPAIKRNYSNFSNYSNHSNFSNYNNNRLIRDKDISNFKRKNQKNQRMKILENINDKYNHNNYSTQINLYNKNNIININQNEEEKIERENLLQSIKLKYKNKPKLNLIENKSQLIDNYIYSNLKKLKEKKYMKCTVLKKEVNQIISDFNKNQNINYGNDINNFEEEIPYNKKGERLYFEYGNDNDSIIAYKKIKLIPNKIKRNKLEICTNNTNNVWKKNNYNFYRKIKHNTSKN